MCVLTMVDNFGVGMKAIVLCSRIGRAGTANLTAPSVANAEER